MTEVFGREYVDAYDYLYKDKNYIEECGLLDRLLQSYGNGTVRSVLDLGCGTGNHSVPLAERGYKVVGVDRSAQMLNVARQKASSQQLNGQATFYEGDIRNIQVEQSFDAS